MIATATYLSFDPQAEINGETIRVMLAAFQLPRHGGNLMRKHGLPAEPVAGTWYPMQSWLNVLGELETTYGEQTVYAAGLQVVHHSPWPPAVRTLAEALHLLETVRQANMRGLSIGYYAVQPEGPRTVRVECFNPSPAAFDHGLLTGLARKFKPAEAVRVRVARESTPTGSPTTLKWFNVSW